ncbi:Polyketide synthase [Aspergillus mulundensis]|uniref:Polyketide synthase n=1 Tax=Aspergillus mulundensis TaxID=1810919 RepID=A0A3D8R4M5_9EURO|nr:Polyketide synthase [Aspergillus mulundensis]RDW68927.1 Polyketide synthase [Aspergillus mulundensis]
MTRTSPINEPIALVGSACRFAGGTTSSSKLWELLSKPRDVRSEIPNSRFNAEAYYHPNPAYHGHSNIRHSYLLDDDVTTFDTEFFGIKPVEAKAIDPQQRLLMETVYEGLESAGLTIDGLRGSDTAVYVGVMCSDYEANLIRDLNTAPTYTATGIGRSIMSNRISYFFDWHGPSITLDTACSSSLVAVHLAVQSLRSGESRVALACGSNLCLGPENYVVESKLKMLSPDGRSKMWDKDANGYARGDGVAAVVLKTLSAAIADGDDIECIIRETGLNQDGATTGITMPSATAQQALIRSTYHKAGLSLEKASDRPQFFEAHGTGTPAGDPIEAEAIARAFFGDGYALKRDGEPLYVGSIKTILGHTEGTAGVAALMKASLALQHATVPPNMLLNNLSDRVAPFTRNLQILQQGRPWPQLAPGQPRRASVNSFGFGGANAHAILESYDSAPGRCSHSTSDAQGPVVPFVFSALSRQSLASSLSAHADYLQANPSTSLVDLAYTLHSRRSTFAYRITFAATTADDLTSRIRAELDGTKIEELGVRFSAPSAGKRRKLLAVFTGQGAQYPRMAAELIEKSGTARGIIRQLQGHLDQLPKELRPDWSLEEELFAAAESSRVMQGAFSSLATAVQILLVDLLRLAGVNFDAVVGHSSGDIAAAYAAGYLTARDAICVAYFRGHLLSQVLRENPNAMQGAMLAAGMSEEDAAALCDDEALKGRVVVAAVNSSSSVTLSGDSDAIDEVKTVLDDEQTFNRKLKVDRAYHSHHMRQGADPYVKAMRAAGVRAVEPKDNQITWVSSVYGRQVTPDMALSAEYWAENMVRPVLFYQALKTTLETGEFDIAIEVGPHPALKGPSSQTIQEVLEKSMPYSGVLSRGIDAVTATASSLGFLWTQLGHQALALQDYDRAVSEVKRPRAVLKGLPAYQWNHEESYRHETRASAKLRSTTAPWNSLLGAQLPESLQQRMSWGQLLRSSELPWLSGHQVQSQTVFPAAGYICTALEAAMVLAADRDIRLIQLRNFVIHQALTFSQDDAGIDVVTCLSDIRASGSNRVRAQFTYSAGLRPDEMVLVAQAELDMTLGQPSDATLASRAPVPPHTIAVDPERFYTFLATLGYGFAGPFQSLSSLRRKLGKSICNIKPADRDAFGHPLLVHPAEMDGAIQSLILAYSYPDDDQLLTMHLPTRIGCIRVNPARCASMADMVADSTLAGRQSAGFLGDVSLYTANSTHAAVQLEGVELVPLGASTAGSDRKVFSKYHWVPTRLDGDLAAVDTVVSKHHEEILMALERISTYYLRQFDLQVPQDSPLRTTSPTSHYLRYARHITGLVESGKHRWARKEWLRDTKEEMLRATVAFAELSDVRVMHLVGEQMPRVFKGETNMLEEFRVNNVLDEYYEKGFGFLQSGLWMSRTIAQLAARYPHLSILEIGAGTGGATKRILRHLGDNFLRYTFTDVSSGFFEKGAEVFAQYKDRMVFKTLDCGQDPVAQGYAEGGYDVVVASLVIHATPDLEVTMRNIRKLVKPGGFLVVADGSNNGQPHGTGGFIFGPLPGWWLGVENGRPLSPFVSTAEWERLLRASGFAGIDSTAPKGFEDVIGMTVFAAQAVDDKVNFLREPLSTQASEQAPISNLVLVGGSTAATLPLVSAVKSSLQDKALQLHVFKTLAQVDTRVLDPDSLVVCLTELDKPVFKDITADEFLAFKSIFAPNVKLFWVTSGRLAEEPFTNMTVGFARTAVHEIPGLRFQNVDVADVARFDHRHMPEMILRFQALSGLGETESDNLLWALEPEIAVDAQGEELAPRLRPVAARNDRYNAARRPITKNLDVTSHPSVLQRDGEGWTLHEVSRWKIPADAASHRKLQVSHAVLSALRTPQGHRFLVLGRDVETHGQYLALLPSMQSVVEVLREAAVVRPLSGLSDAQLLTECAASLVATAIIEPIVGDAAVVVHNAPKLVAQAIANQADRKGVQAVFLKDSTLEPPAGESAIILEPYMTHAELAPLIPFNTACFVALGSEESENAATVRSCLPRHCRTDDATTLYAPTGWESATSDASAGILGQLLQRVVDGVQSGDETAGQTETVGVDELLQGATLENPTVVLDWTRSSTYPVRISRLDSVTFFKGDRTYWMCGLSGALGISLCDWMIERGARHLALTSRNPNISPKWIEGHARNGVTVKIFPCDVTNEPALRKTHAVIRDTLPPISGVLNGAMVLRDVSIQNMSFQQMSDVFRPKVYGSIHLDRIFANEPLDFFILFSSINCVIGNLGQANYSAANTFMTALAAQRRKRGLAAIAIDIGAIIGAGYMERESSKALDLTVSKMALMHLSEQDYHQLFAEGIDAGRPDSGDEAELITGLLDIPAARGPNAPRWQANPTFSAFVIHQTQESGAASGGEAAVSIRDQLVGCKSAGAVLGVVKRTFAAQLRNVLQMSTADEDLMAVRSRDIGLDSLISVDIRSWFLKNFEVSIPVLKIMGNDTMAELAELVATQLPPALIPELGGDSPKREEENAGASENDVERASSSGGDDSLDSSSSSSSNTAPTTPALTRPPSRIICLATRQLAERLSTGDLPSNPKVVYHAGDLADPLLGLSQGEAISIFSRADALIHNGADTSHLKSYASIKAANTESTRTLIALCAARAVPIHYISTVGVALFANPPVPSFPPISAAAYTPPPDGSHGYIAAKWASERMLEALAQEHGVKVWIHRPSTIIREGAAARNAAAAVDWMNAFVEYMVRMRAVPRLVNLRGALDLVSLKRVGGEILQCVMRNTIEGVNGVDYLHEVGDVVIPLDAMDRFVRERVGGGDDVQVDVVSVAEWARRAVKAGLNAGIAALIESMDDPGQPHYPRMLRA